LTPTIQPDFTPVSSQTGGFVFTFKQKPVFWFSPLPPLPVAEGRSFTGSLDFMDLFIPDASWKYVSSKIQVFKLYGEWVAYEASDEELRLAVDGIRELGLGLAVEAGPLTAPANCGQGIEGFAGINEGLTIARRILKAGGVIDLLAMDEPYYYGHFYDSPNACHWTDRQIALEIQKYIQAMRTVFPNVLVGDTEPLAGSAGAPEYQAWMVAFHAVTGTNLAFLHLDIDWSRPNWPSEVKSVDDFGRQRGVPVGIIYTGNATDTSDETWLAMSGERIKRYEMENREEPAQVVFQSWNDKPDRNLPESDSKTFTGMLYTFFTDKNKLGVKAEMPGTNLAYNRPVRYSSAQPDHPASFAVDGNPGTWWGSGDFPPLWIEIDLGAASNIQTIRLLPSQTPSGKTVHRLSVRGPLSTNAYTILFTLQGDTQDLQWLVFNPDQPLIGIRYIRIDTLQSPTWVSWREIEIIKAATP